VELQIIAKANIHKVRFIRFVFIAFPLGLNFVRQCASLGKAESRGEKLGWEKMEVAVASRAYVKYHQANL
jgi:hypothetical protein